jgi:hypothetical protein
MSTAQVAGNARHAVRETGEAANDVARHAQQAASSGWFEWAARFGYVVRGTLYLMVGVLATLVALGQGGEVTTPRGAIETISTLPFGKVLLILIAVGLAAYGLWGFVRAFLDPLGRGTKLEGLAQRFAYFMSGCTYTALVPFTLRLITNTAGGEGGVEMPYRLLATPGGSWILGIIGLIWIFGVGGGQFWEAWHASFKKDFEHWEMSGDHLKWATLVGRIGLAARGVVFAILGLFLVIAAKNGDANEAKGLDGALQALAIQPAGMVLLGIVALGLVCFGLYSYCCARWVKI